MSGESEWEEMMLSSLPEKPGEELRSFRSFDDELGAPIIFFKRESRADYETDWIFGIETDEKPRWTASCRCTECGEEFFAPWGKNSFYVVTGDDGTTYANIMDIEEEPGVVEIREHEKLCCPFCDTECTAIRTTGFNQRTFRTQAATLENVSGTTVLMYWLVSRTLTVRGYREKEICPREAVAVSPKGKLVRFSHTKHYLSSESYLSRWERRKTFAEPEMLKFTSEGMPTVGTWCVPYHGDITGQTGEKTGIDDYWGEAFPSVYLKLWNKHRNMENLTRCGADFAGELVRLCVNTYTNSFGVRKKSSQRS